MIDGTYETGLAGEAVAADDLRRRGFAIVGQRYRTRWGELDLIARRGDLICFVEVKAAGPGRRRRADSISRRNQHRLRRAAVAWMAAELRQFPRVKRFRFDLAVVKVDDDGLGTVEWWTNAF